MFYFLHYLTHFSDGLGVLNIFRYVNFRAMMAAVTAMLVRRLAGSASDRVVAATTRR